MKRTEVVTSSLRGETCRALWWREESPEVIHALVPWPEKCPTLPWSSAPRNPTSMSSCPRCVSGSGRTWGESGRLCSKSLCAAVVIVWVVIGRNLCLEGWEGHKGWGRENKRWQNGRKGSVSRWEQGSFYINQNVGPRCWASIRQACRQQSERLFFPDESPFPST